MTESDWLTATDPAPMLELVGDRVSPREQLNFMAGCLRRVWDLLTDDRYRRLVEAAEDVADGRAEEQVFRELGETIPRPGGRIVPPRPDWRRDFEHQPPELSQWPTLRGIGGPRMLPAGIRNFGNLPNWVQQSHYAIENLARRQPGTVSRLTADARGDRAATVVIDQHAMNVRIAELEANVRRAYDRAADAKWRGLGRFPEIEAEARRLELRTEREVADLRGQIGADADTVMRTATAAERAWQAVLLRGVVGNPFRRPPFDLAAKTPTAVALVRAVVEDRGYDRLPILADALEESGFADAEALAFLRGDPTVARGCWVLDAVLYAGATG